MSGSGVSSLRSLLLERDAELEELKAAFEGVPEGTGRFVLVEAQAGTGKSALLSAALALPQAATLKVLRARGSELEGNFAFGVIRQLFERPLLTAEPVELARLLAGAASPAERVVLTGPGKPDDAGAAGFATLHAIYWLAEHLAALAPLLLVIDDAHWADASSLRALNHLAGRVADSPIGLIVAMRPEEPGSPVELLDELRLQPDSRRISLSSLGLDSVARVVADRLPEADAPFCEACAAVSAGNPLYLEELLRAMSGEELRTAADTVAAVHEASAPSLGERAMRRIARLSDKAPALASAMAVLGDGGRLTVAAAMAGLSEKEAGRIAHPLRRIEILSEEDPVAFVHPLVRRSVYDALSATDRNALHSSAAELLRDAGAPPERVAVHLASVPPRGSSSVAATLVDAAEGALARAAPDEAISWYRRGLEEQAPEPPAGETLMSLGLAQVTMRDTEAIANLYAALELTEEPLLRVRITSALAEILMLAGQWQRGTELVAAVGNELNGAHPELKAELYAELAAVRAVVMAHDPALVGDFDRERERFTELAMHRQGWAAHALAAVLAAVAAHRSEPPETVYALADRAFEGGTLLGERAGGWASIQVLIALVEIDDHERALAACEEVSAAGRRDGSVTGVVAGLGCRGWVRGRQGDLIAAEAELRSALVMARQSDTPMIDVTALFFAEDAVLERASFQDFAALAEEIVLDPAFAETWTGGMLLMTRGRLRVAGGDRRRGTEDLRRAVAMQRALGWGPTIAPARSILALALSPQQRDEAINLVGEELSLAEATGLDRPLGVTLRAAGILAGGERGIEQLSESAFLLERADARYEHALSLVELGAALRRGRRRTEARSRLAGGMELADRCGAERLVSRARAELNAAGGRPRRIATSGPAALTASERRVADLAARGDTNPEIAQELFVGLKTVETHLSHAYAKLDIAGGGARRRLAQALGQES